MKFFVFLLMLTPFLASAQSAPDAMTRGEAYCIAGFVDLGYNADANLKSYCGNRTMGEALCMVGLAKDKYKADHALKNYCNDVSQPEAECMTSLTPKYRADNNLKAYCSKE